MNKRKRPLMGCAACVAGVFTALTVWQNIRIKTTRYELRAENLP